jgi:surface antigen
MNITHSTSQTMTRTQPRGQARRVAKWRRALKRVLPHRRATKYALIAGNVVLLVGIVAFVWHETSASQVTTSLSRTAAATTQASGDPLDQLSSADIAVNLANMTALPESTAVKNQADSVNAQLAVASAENTVISKPQTVATALKSRTDIQTYVVQAGDDVASIAAKFNVTSDSIKWSNGLTSNSVNPGVKLVIPPVNGIVYTVKAGDTPDSLAQKYQANKDQIIAYNDAEISGLQAGEQIIIPNGQQATVSRSSYGSFYGGTATYGSNGYDYGFCTYWVALRRQQVGKPLPNNLGNASTWPYLARAYGLSVGSTPAVYAAVVTSTVGEGHVAFVESVGADGSITVSEMNHIGWGRTDTRTFSAAEAANFSYIY